MKPKTIMLIAGEASGDVLAAELVKALRTEIPEAEKDSTGYQQPWRTSLEPRFFCAGGPRLAEAGAELVLDLTAHSVVGLSDVIKNLAKYRRFFQQLKNLAIEREPDAIICVDFSGFNLRLAGAIRCYIASLKGTFGNWNPLMVQYISPQVWASRAGRARKMERWLDLVLSIFPFEKKWYAEHVPNLRVEYIGHPLVERYANWPAPCPGGELKSPPTVLLLPGSRPGELHRHLAVMAEAVRQIGRKLSFENKVVLPNAELAGIAKKYLANYPELVVQVSGLPNALCQADLALACTGTITMECARFGVPTVTLYKTSWSTYEIGKRLVQVPYLTMPNILAGKPVYPEFIQHEATVENLAGAGLELLTNKARRVEIKTELRKIIESLGPPGACRRAAQVIARMLAEKRSYRLRATLG